MASYQHPGVFVEELQDPPTIQGVPTSVPLFIGVTDKGPPETPILVTSWSSYVSQFGFRIWQGFASWAVYEFFQGSEGQGQCYVYKVTQPKSAFAAGTTLPGIRAASAGIWGNNIGIILTTTDGITTNLANWGSLVTLNVAVKRSSLPILPDASHVDLSLLARYVDQNSFRNLPVGTDTWTVLESFTGLWDDSATGLKSMAPDMAKEINSTSFFIRIDDSTKAVRPVGGKLSTVPMLGSGASYSFTFPLTTDDKKEEVLRLPGVGLLALPEIPTLADPTGLSTLGSTINSALSFCSESKKLFYVIDCPFFLKVQEMINFKSGILTGNASFTNEKPSPPLVSPLGFGGMYYPGVDVFDPTTGVRVTVPPSGPVLARYAYTDGRVGVHKSAAGTADGLLQTVAGLVTAISDKQQDDLNPQGINAIRNLSIYGNLIWGARTLAPPGSEWIYVPVRRLFIAVEQSLLASLPWAVFERNGPKLREAVKREVTDFLTGLWNAGALAGATQAEAFYVICDDSNNTENTIKDGYLNINVGLAPLRPAEFVVVHVAQKLATPTSGS